MPRKTKDAPGRVTPKGGAKKAAAPQSAATGRYTPPIPRAARSSPWWVPALIVAFFVVGIAVILLNYLGIFGSGASNTYLFIGLGLIVAGFITSTRWH